MGLVYACENAERRALLIEADPPVANGIDYLEVDAAQTTLRVHFLHPLPGQPGGVPAAPALTAPQVVVRGGVRVVDPRVTAISAAGKVLTVTVQQPGDFSRYLLALVATPTAGDPPSGFDPVSSEVPFSFKVDCPSDFDCQPADDCREELPAAPRIDYLARDYASFRRLMLDRMSVTAPGWTERNPADVGVTVVELLAYAADRLSYHQDAAATEAYLSTARLRSSVRRHARLLDYPMHDGANARVWLAIEVAEPPPGADPTVLPARTPVLTAEAESPVVIRPWQVEAAASRGATVFETLHDAELRPERNLIELHTWGNEDCCLPRGATRATLKGAEAELGLRAGDVLLFEEIVGADSGLPQDADLSHRHAVRLSERPRQRVDPIGGETVIEVAWHARDALPFALCLRWKVRDGQRRPAAVARGNVVLADHGRTFPASPVWKAALNAPSPPPWEPLSLPIEGRSFRPPLDRPGAAFARAYDEGRARRQAATAILDGDLRTVRAAVELRGAGTEWTPRRDLLNSRPFSADFVVEAQDDGRASLRFGDGVHGRAPAAGTEMRARYRLGGARAGNVGADSLVRIAAMPGPADRVLRVRNPLAAAGGTDPEPIEKVRLHAPQAFRVQERAVTETDYAAAAERHPEVQRAAATRRWTGSWYTVFVTVDRVGGLPVDANFEARLRAFLERFRMAGYDLEIDAPRFVPLDVAFSVCAKPGYSRADVRQALLRELGTGELPDGRRGFFHPDEWTFGQPVYLSPLVARAMGVAGVDWVDFASSPTAASAHRFHRLGKAAAGELEAAAMKMGRLEVARLDNDPSAPENGRLEIFMRGGS